MMLDGFRVTITGIALYPKGKLGGDSYTTVSQEKKDVYFGREFGDQKVQLDVYAKAGSYIGANVQLSKHIGVKGFCRTVTKFAYTTAKGMATMDVAVGDALTSMPSDYDYYNYQAKYGTETDKDDVMNAFVWYDIEIDSTTTSIVLMMDSTFLFTCYDGQLPDLKLSNSDTYSMLSPFTDYITGSGATESMYAYDTPYPGLVYLPMFVWVDTGSTTSNMPTGETYAVDFDNDASKLDNFVEGNSAGGDFKNIGVFTIVVNPDQTLYSAQLRNSGSWSGFVSFDGPVSNTYVINIGSYDYNTGMSMHDRTLLNFTRSQSDYSTIHKVASVDGPDCASMSPPDCQYSTNYVYFKALKRD